MANYRPQCFIRTADITASLTFPEGTPDADNKMVMPGDNVEMVCNLVFDIALEVGTRLVNLSLCYKSHSTWDFRFTLREANKTSEYFSVHPLFTFSYSMSAVGTGIVTEILEYA